MTIEPFRTEDIDALLELAVLENWITERWEFDFMLKVFPHGCFAARGERGETLGFVTSLSHERSGWIGNLIVSEKFRGRRIGEALFRSALAALKNGGVETVWLTASTSGKSLYEKYGFKRTDSIVRWTGKAMRRSVSRKLDACDGESSAMIASIDFQAWGDRRDALLRITIERGRLLKCESGFAIIQDCGDAKQIGPFAALGYRAAEQLFREAIRTVPAGTKFYIDAPASNRAASRLFKRMGMMIAGRNELMYCGRKPDYRPEYVYGLATMGSCG